MILHVFAESVTCSPALLSHFLASTYHSVASALLDSKDLICRMPSAGELLAPHPGRPDPRVQSLADLFWSRSASEAKCPTVYTQSSDFARVLVTSLAGGRVSIGRILAPESLMVLNYSGPGRASKHYVINRIIVGFLWS
jgi:hypothetical protein